MEIKTRFENIVEKRIREAFEEGKFKNLPGHGKPLELEDDSNVPEDLRLSYKILKNAGCVPRELELNVQIRQVEDLLDEMTDVKEKYRTSKKLDILKQKMALQRRTDTVFNIPDRYENKVIERLEGKKGKSEK